MHIKYVLINIIVGWKHIVEGGRGTKVKVFFQGLYMTHVIFVLVYNLVFSISSTLFNIAF
jgi:hypothetical protein